MSILLFLKRYSSFLTNRTEHVRVNSTLSGPRSISTGEPQGCVGSSSHHIQMIAQDSTLRTSSSHFQMILPSLFLCTKIAIHQLIILKLRNLCSGLTTIIWCSIWRRLRWRLWWWSDLRPVNRLGVYGVEQKSVMLFYQATPESTTRYSIRPWNGK